MNKIKTELTEMLGIDYPIILAPMFLVSNEAMVLAAAEAGITGCIPALNWRTVELMREGLKSIKEKTDKPVGINLIVNKSNLKLKEQLQACVDYKVDYIITSLGSPEPIIKTCKENNIKVFCDVVDLKYAQKVESLGADAIIAVNSGAGGHAGKIPASVLVPLLKEHCNIPVISAGGIGTGAGLCSMLSLGAAGVSVGSPFIATTEAGVNNEYKQAIVDYGAKDIVMTTKLSGTPCTIIETPYVKKIGTDQNPVESFLNKNRNFKKYAKLLTAYKGMKMLEKAAFQGTYKTMWCAGPSIEFVNDIKPIKERVQDLVSGYKEAVDGLCANR